MERTLAWELLGTPGEVDKNTHKCCTFVGSTKTHQQQNKKKKKIRVDFIKHCQYEQTLSAL